MKTGDAFLVVPTELIVPPACQGQIVGVLSGELELDSTPDGEGLNALRQFRRESIIEIVMVRLEFVFERIERIIEVVVYLAVKFSRT